MATDLIHEPGELPSQGRLRRSHDFYFVPAVNSPAMQHIDCVIGNIATSDVPILLIGEPGVGKETLAVHIHRCSNRASQPFVVVEGSSLRAPLDRRARRGIAPGLEALFTHATVFIKNIGGMAADVQGYLLELLSDPQEPVSARIIGSHSQPLDSAVSSGTFIEELQYRISSVCLRVPPLRHRKDDIPILAEFFAAKYAALFGQMPLTLSPAMVGDLCAREWPGNVRELESALKAAVAVGDESVAIKTLRPAHGQGRSAEIPRVATSLKQAARAASREAERELILQVLTSTGWNRKRAAQHLQISYKALLYKLKQNGITRPEAPETSRGTE
ncbi:MAG TPA: sigma 54-interacting transcriptional regulator [Terriglobales bacterium]|nr:sigma 54-interacting transcriptional regulator [Terriglobales bacterium]